MSDASNRIEKLIADLLDSSRKKRQEAALALADCSKDDAQAILPYGDALVDALDTRDARTRWAIIDVLTALSVYDADLCVKALPGIEDALFDENNGPLHLASFRFLCSYGAQSLQASDNVWSLLDEAIQCFHGDQEFQDMLNLLVDFSLGNLSAETKKNFSDRMLFDARNNRGLTQRRAQTIVDNLAK